MELLVNGRTFAVEPEPDRPLLWVLRDELGLMGAKFGCAIGICGACTVHVDGAATRSCITLLSASSGKAITTLEGLATVGADGKPRLHPVQQAFEEEQVHQCGYCMSGQIMAAAALLARNPRPSEGDIVEAMSGVLCRCGTYMRIKRAVARAAAIMGGAA